MSDLYDTYRPSLARSVEALAPVPDQVGALFAVDGTIVGLDFFDAAATLARLLPKLVASHALELVDTEVTESRTLERTDATALLQGGGGGGRRHRSRLTTSMGCRSGDGKPGQWVDPAVRFLVIDSAPGPGQQSPHPGVDVVRISGALGGAAMARASPTSVISHWHHSFEGLQASPMEFYASIEQAVQRREIPDTFVSRVDWREGGPLSAKREYLRVQRKEHIFDICGAPFGRGFFVSWWLGEPEGCFSGCLNALLLNIPLLIKRLLRPLTYYHTDTALMFQDSVHTAVLEIVDEMTTAKGLRALTELERKPILREFYRRR